MTISKMYGTAVFPEETASRDKPTKRIITFRAGGRKDCSMWSSAHRLSVRAVIDPTYSALEPSPAMLEADDRPYWHYEAEEFLLHRLETMHYAQKSGFSNHLKRFFREIDNTWR